MHNRDVAAGPDGASLWVKLSDFGLSKIGELVTVCETKTYMPPEIPRSEEYTELVDIWSLGVVVLELAYRLPKPGYYDWQEFTLDDWCHKIVDEANGRETGGLVELLKRMLVINLKARPAAAHIIQEAFYLLSTHVPQATTLTPASYAIENTGQLSSQESHGLSNRVCPIQIAHDRYSDLQ